MASQAVVIAASRKAIAKKIIEVAKKAKEVNNVGGNIQPYLAEIWKLQQDLARVTAGERWALMRWWRERGQVVREEYAMFADFLKIQKNMGILLNIIKRLANTNTKQKTWLNKNIIAPIEKIILLLETDEKEIRELLALPPSSSAYDFASIDKGIKKRLLAVSDLCLLILNKAETSKTLAGLGGNLMTVKEILIETNNICKKLREEESIVESVLRTEGKL